MKVTLIFLLFFVSFSYQQRWAPYPIPNQFVYYPGYFYQGSPYYYYNNIEDLSEDSDTEGRNKQSPAYSRRFLLPNFLSNMLLPYYTTSTKTIYKAVTSTTTVASIQSCISSAQFMMGFQPAGGPGSITPCARRRRDLLEDLIEKKDHITPSQVELLVPTEVMQNDISNRAIIPEISSSLSVSNDDESVVQNRIIRNRAMITIRTTTTSTFTSYSFSVYTVKKFYTLVSFSSLLCLPSGYTVC